MIGPIWTVDNWRDGYVGVCQAVLRHGSPVTVRGQATLEIIGGGVTLLNPQDALPIGVGRKLNLAIAAVEAAQFVGGFSNPELMVKIQPRFADFMDDGKLSGAYGPRTGMQFEMVADLLKRDPTTRQAVVSLWKPLVDLATPTPRDVPCTNHVQFLIRDGALHSIFTMRSSDVWWGMAYDMFQFAQVALTMANVLRIECGPVHHRAGSFHAYERDFESIKALEPAFFDVQAVHAIPEGFRGRSWKQAAESAARSMDFSQTPTYEPEFWYRRAIRRYA